MSRGLLSASREYQFPARWVARSFLTLQFISPARLNLRPPLSRARRRRRNLHPRGATRAREKGAPFNKSPAVGRGTGKRPFISLTFPTAFRDANRALANGFRRDRHLRSRSFNNWCHLAARRIIYVAGNICGCINNDAKRLLNNPRWEYISPGKQVLRKLRAPCSHRISYHQPLASLRSSSSCWSSTTKSRSRSSEIYIGVAKRSG